MEGRSPGHQPPFRKQLLHLIGQEGNQANKETCSESSCRAHHQAEETESEIDVIMTTAAVKLQPESPPPTHQDITESKPPHGEPLLTLDRGSQVQILIAKLAETFPDFTQRAREGNPQSVFTCLLGCTHQ